MSLPLDLPIDPMLASAVDRIPDGPGFAHEPKWDGFRCIISRDGDRIALDGRGKKPLTPYFPEVVSALSSWLPDGAILDAELIVRASTGPAPRRRRSAPSGTRGQTCSGRSCGIRAR